MYFSCYVCYLFIYRASKVQKSKNRFVRADVLFAELASDFGGELVVGGGPFREPPTVMQSTVVVGIRNNRRTRRGAEYDTYLDEKGESSKSEIPLASSRHSAVRRPSTLRSRYYYYNKPHYDWTDSLKRILADMVTGKFPSPAGVSDSDRPHGLQGSDCTKSRLRGHKSASQATKNGKEAKNKKKRVESWNHGINRGTACETSLHQPARATRREFHSLSGTISCGFGWFLYQPSSWNTNDAATGRIGHD